MRVHKTPAYSRLLQELRAARREMRALRAQLQSARQEEQLRIARDLHDKVAGQAASLHYFIAAAAANDGADIAPAVELSRGVLDQLRSAVSDMREASATDLGVELQRLLQLYPQLRVHCNGQLPHGLAADEVATLSACIQECMTNELKHSTGDELWLDFGEDGHNVLLTVSSTQALQQRVQEGNGFKGMRERIEKSAGKTRFLAKPGAPLQCCFSLPRRRLAS